MTLHCLLFLIVADMRFYLKKTMQDTSIHVANSCKQVRKTVTRVQNNAEVKKERLYRMVTPYTHCQIRLLHIGR